MIYSLRWQLLFSMVVVILVTVAMTAFLANRAANAEIDRVQVQDDNNRSRRLGVLFSRHYYRYSGWRSAQGLLEDVGTLYGQRVVLVNHDGLVVADTLSTLQGRYLDPNLRTRTRVPIVGPEGNLGTLMIAPEIPRDVSAQTVAPTESVDRSLARYLILSGLLAVGVAVVFTYFLSRRILRPVESLAKAARSVSQHDYSMKAEAKSRDEVGDLSRTFNSMVDELARTDELRRNLVADLAHELRTPITNIRGYIEGFSDGVIAPDKDTLTSVHGEVLLLGRLIDDLQDLALAESGQMRLQPQACDLGELAGNAVTAMQSQAQAKDISLSIEASSALPLQADPERIAQVARILLDNALSYTPEGGAVVVSCQLRGDSARLEVVDNGPGIPPEDLPQIFERFYRVDKSRNRATGGVGLGLTIARRLTEANGGQIWAESTFGQGSRFIVELPLDKA